MKLRIKKALRQVGLVACAGILVAIVSFSQLGISQEKLLPFAAFVEELLESDAVGGGVHG